MDESVLCDKRKAIRIPCNGTVRFSADQFNWYLNRAQNISKEGLFIETGKVFTPGTRLSVQIDLSVYSRVVEQIRTVGQVVRSGKSGDETFPTRSGGMGIHFSLLPGEERIIRDFARHPATPSGAEKIPAGHSPARHRYIEVCGEACSYLKWWLQEALKTLFNTKSLILELAALLAVIVIYVFVFLD